MQVLTDPVDCGPVTLAMCQDVQAEAFDYPESFFAPQVRATIRRPGADPDELARAVELLRQGRAAADRRGRRRAVSARPRPRSRPSPRRHRIPVAETQAGKSSIAWDHPQAVGSIGVTGSSAANTLAREADLILARRHAAAGLHDRLAARCCRVRPRWSSSTFTPSTPASTARSRSSATPSGRWRT